MASKIEKGRISPVTKVYLLLYNFIQVFGWAYLLYVVVNYYTFSSSKVPLWELVRTVLVVFQNAAVLEILHAAIGIVPSNVIITFIQVLSRVIVVCGVLLATPTAPYSIGLPMVLVAWSLAEITRYSYYGFNLLGGVPKFLLWCRYTFFLVLYPLGVSGELLCLYSAQKYVGETKMWTLEMPNIFNVIFNYQCLLIIIMISYIPLFPQMYMHMLVQRKKFLGGEVKKKH